MWRFIALIPFVKSNFNYVNVKCMLCLKDMLIVDSYWNRSAYRPANFLNYVKIFGRCIDISFDISVYFAICWLYSCPRSLLIFAIPMKKHFGIKCQYGEPFMWIVANVHTHTCISTCVCVCSILSLATEHYWFGNQNGAQLRRDYRTLID